MQILFNIEYLLEKSFKENKAIFSPSLDQFPFEDCSLPVKLKRLEHYLRYLIGKPYKGVLYIMPIYSLYVKEQPPWCLSSAFLATIAID